MGGKSKSTTVGYWYKIAFHSGLGIGPIDAYLEFRGGDKTAWSGEARHSQSIEINAPNLWGGEKDQGGIVGTVDLMFGEAEQQPSARLAAIFGPQQPAWCGLATLAFTGKYGAMNPYPQQASHKILKTRAGWDGDCWNPDQAEIPMSRHVRNAEVDENFSGGLGDYTLESGSLGRFAVVTDGGAPALAISGNGDAIIKKPLGLSGLLRSVSLRFKQVIAGSDDFACFDLRRADGLYVFGFNVRRQGPGRPTCYLSRGTSTSVDAVFSAVTLVADHWYRFEATFSDAAGSYACSIIDETTGGVLQTISLALGAGGQLQTATTLVWRHEGPDGEGRFADVRMVFDAQVVETIGINPGHALYYARTHSEIGRTPVSAMNDASYRAAAARLFGEGFGICTSYSPQTESLDEFEQRICRLIGGSVSRSLTTGQYYLDLARGDYVLADLPILTDDDILDIKIQPSVPSGAINSVSVKYFDPLRKESITTPPVQAMSLIDAFGVISQINEYPEIPTGSLALRVADRDVRASTAPTRTMELSVIPEAVQGIRPNQYFRLQSVKRRIADMVCLMGDRQAGTLKSGAVRVTATEDIYSLPATSFVEVEPGIDTRPDPKPNTIILQAAFEAPYIELVQRLDRANLDALPTDAGYLLAVADQPPGGRSYSLAVSAAGGDFDISATGDWCPFAVVAGDPSVTYGPGVTTIPISSIQRGEQLVIGAAAMWDSEIVRIDAIDIVAGAVVLGRGCADTVEGRHAGGSVIWLYDTAAVSDLVEYTDGESVAVKLLTNTGSAQLALSAAAAMAVEFAGRQARPYPPAAPRLNGEAWPTEIFTTADVSWQHRDRLAQADQLVDQAMASIGPEPGTTYTVRWYLNGVLVNTEDGLAGTSASYVPTANGALRVEIEAQRGDLTSWQLQVIECAYRTSPYGDYIDQAADRYVDHDGNNYIG